MMMHEESTRRYIYTYACHDNERQLCEMELNALFGTARRTGGFLESETMIDPSRSPFMSSRIEVLFMGERLEDISAQAAALSLDGRTFKVIYVKSGDELSYEEQRAAERQVGQHIRGKAEMRKPDVTYSLMSIQGRWLIGTYLKAESVWLQHKHKPRNYSTGLSTLVARALVNIAAPDPSGMRAIDPCCGMGNVLIEALSMGLDIVGRDINPLAVRGARINLRHFGYESGRVQLGDLNEVDQQYDAAIVDMPYNLCSVLPPEERQQMLTSIRRFSKRSVIVSSEELEDEIRNAGLCIIDYGTVSKGSFVRHIWLCEAQ
ncbi:Modification methylase VspI [compost metagenome]